MNARKNHIPVLLSCTLVRQNIVIMERTDLEILMDMHILASINIKKWFWNALSLNVHVCLAMPELLDGFVHIQCLIVYSSYISENLVCSKDSENCMLHRCSNCTWQSHLWTLVEELFHANNFDVEDSIVYKQQVHDDHTKIVYITNTAGHFTGKIWPTADLTASHHYWPKLQVSYLKMKETFLPKTEGIILLCFLDNCLFLCQDTVRRFHWETEQASLHPSGFYYCKIWSQITWMKSV